MTTLPEDWTRLFLKDECSRFAEYWLQLRGDDLVPSRRNLKPSEIRDLLPYLSILERLSEHEFRYRLVGTAVVSRSGFDNTRRTFSLRDLRSDSPFSHTVLSVLDWPCGYYLLAEERYKTGLKAVVELLGFPLSGDLGAPRFIATLSHECSKKYSNFLHDSELKEMTGQGHRFLDIGAGAPPAIDASFTYQPKALSVDSDTAPRAAKK